MRHRLCFFIVALCLASGIGTVPDVEASPLLQTLNRFADPFRWQEVPGELMVGSGAYRDVFYQRRRSGSDDDAYWEILYGGVAVQRGPIVAATAFHQAALGLRLPAGVGDLDQVDLSVPLGGTALRVRLDGDRFRLEIDGRTGEAPRLGGEISRVTPAGTFSYGLAWESGRADILLVWPLLRLDLDLSTRAFLNSFSYHSRSVSLKVAHRSMTTENRDDPFDMRVETAAYSLTGNVQVRRNEFSFGGSWLRTNGTLRKGSTVYGSVDNFDIVAGWILGRTPLGARMSFSAFGDAVYLNLPGENFVSVVPFSGYGGLYPLRYRNISSRGWMAAPGLGLNYARTTRWLGPGTFSWSLDGAVRYLHAAWEYSLEERRFTLYPIFFTYDDVSENLIDISAVLGTVGLTAGYRIREFEVSLELQQHIPVFVQDRLRTRSASGTGQPDSEELRWPTTGTRLHLRGVYRH